MLRWKRMHVKSIVWVARFRKSSQGLLVMVMLQ